MTEVEANALQHPVWGAARPDPLAEVLDGLLVRVWTPGRFELTVPWGIEIGDGRGWFHLVQEGSCLIDVDGDDGSSVSSAGDLILLPPGRAHRLRDRPDRPLVPFERLLDSPQLRSGERVTHGGGGPRTLLLSGCYQMDDPAGGPLEVLLPPAIRVEGYRGQPIAHVDYLARLIVQEAASCEPCAPALINRLVRILLIKTLQDFAATLPAERANWLRAWSDPDIGRALSLIHAHPELPWTVASLGENVSMSRSAFSERFTAVVGVPPLEYLTRWRMRRASQLLRTSRAGLKEIAVQVGYDSAASFGKAFTRWSGEAPGAYRQRTASETSWA